MTTNITGDKQLDHALEMLKSVAIGRVRRSAVGKALRVIAKGMKGQIPPEYKEMKRAIGSRYAKEKGGPDRGETRAKVGLGVGMTSKKLKSFKRKDRPGQPGLGIQPENVHWFVLGTKSRRTKAGQSTGQMPALLENVIRQGYEASAASAASAMVDGIRQGLEREAARVSR